MNNNEAALLISDLADRFSAERPFTQSMLLAIAGAVLLGGDFEYQMCNYVAIWSRSVLTILKERHDAL